MTEDEQKADDRVDDLDVPAAETEDVKGGLPAVQKVRDAGAQMKGGGEGQIEVESYSWSK